MTYKTLLPKVDPLELYHACIQGQVLSLQRVIWNWKRISNA